MSQVGKITQVIGAVVDVQFTRPPACDPERARDRQQRQPAGSGSRSAPWREHRAHDRDGQLPRGWSAARRSPTPAQPISVPVGNATLGRILNVVGEPIDEGAPMECGRGNPPDPPARSRNSSPSRRESEVLVTGIKVVDLLAPYAKGGKIGPVRRRRRGQDRADHGTDQQHRQGALGLLGVRRCG